MSKDITAGNALDGVRVLDMSQGVAGPYCSLLLRTVGATVIKVEPPDGDWLRQAGPPWAEEISAAAFALNRGKESVVLDVSTEVGASALLRLLRSTDVLIHDMTEAVAAQRGLAPVDLRAVNPSLIDCSVTPMGEVGPWADLPATELEVQAVGGVWNYLGEIGAAPERLGADVAGVLGGCAAFQAVLAALLVDEPTMGQHVSTSQLGALMGTNSVMIAALDDPDTWDGFHCNAASYPPDHGIETADSRIYYGQPLRSEEAWQDFCREIGAEEILDDPRFATRELRMPNMAHLRRALQPHFQRFDTDELVEKIIRSDGIAVPVQDHQQLVDHPQIDALGIVVEAERIPSLAPPWRAIDNSIHAVTAGAPLLGQDTERVLARHGFLPAEFQQLVASGSVATSAISEDAR